MERLRGREASRGGAENKRARREARPSMIVNDSASVEPAGRVGQHGVDLAGLGGQISARHHLAAIVARDFLQKPLELADIAVDRLLELAIGAIALADLLERLLPGGRVEPLAEDVALAAIVAVPQVGRGVMVDHAGDVDREGVERLDRLAGALGRAGRALVRPHRRTVVCAWTLVLAGRRRSFLARGAAQEI